MTQLPHSPISRLLLLASCLSLNSACSDFAAAVREITYPPDFKYVSGQELRSDMHWLAFELQQLDLTLTKDYAPATNQQQEVLETLGRLEAIAGRLQAGDAGSNHPFLYDHMSSFVNDISQARNAAALDPPRYYLAGRISGSCVNCHRINR